MILSIILAANECSKLCPFLFGGFAYDVSVGKDEGGDLCDNLANYLNKKHWRTMILFLAGIYFACCNLDATGIYSVFSNFAYLYLIRAAGITIILYVLWVSPQKARVLEIRPLLWIGNLSPYIYAFHWPIILSFGCWLYVVLYHHVSYDFAVIIVSVASIIVTLLFSYGYTKATALLIRLWQQKRMCLLKNKAKIRKSGC